MSQKRVTRRAPTQNQSLLSTRHILLILSDQAIVFKSIFTEHPLLLIENTRVVLIHPTLLGLWASIAAVCDWLAGVIRTTFA